MWHTLGNMAGVEGPSPRPDVSYAQTRGSGAEISMAQVSLEPWDMSQRVITFPEDARGE